MRVVRFRESGEVVDPAPLTELFFATIYFWLVLLLTTPVITMRTFASEKASGTYETLMTAPVSDLQVVLAIAQKSAASQLTTDN